MAGFDFTDVHKGEAADTERYLISFIPLAQREAEKTEQPNFGYSLADIFTNLTPDDFGDHTNRKLFAAAQDLFKRREHIDEDSIGINAGRMFKDMTETTARLEMMRICAPDANGTPTVQGWRKAIEAVKRNSVMRQTLFAMGDYYMDLATGKAEDGTVQNLQDKLLHIMISAQSADWEENSCVNQTTKQIGIYQAECDMTPEQVAENTFLFPIKGLNELTHNAMSRGEFWVIAAKSGVGKTVFATQTAAWLAGKGRHVLYVTGEERTRDIIDRVVSNECTINYGRVSKKLGKDKFDQNDWTKLISWSDKMGNEFMTVRRAEEMDVIECYVRTALAHNALDVLVVDHLQLLDPLTRTGKKYGTETEEMKDIVKTLHRWAQEYNIVVIALSQGNRDKTAQTAKGGLTLDSLYGGAVIGMFANGVLALTPDPNDEKGQLTECNILKCRRGRKGTVSLLFDGAHQRFLPADPDAWKDAQAAKKNESDSQTPPTKRYKNNMQVTCTDLFNGANAGRTGEE